MCRLASYLALMLLAACMAGDTTRYFGPNDVEFASLEAAEVACQAVEGAMIRGMMPRYSCALPYADGGKSCRVDGDCTGLCRAPEGICQTHQQFGCVAYFDGQGQPMTICID